MSNELPDSALAEFIAECTELSQRVSSNLGQIEKGTHSQETINEVYRDIHTIKGTSRLFGYEQIGEVTHAMEASMEPYRDKGGTVPPALIDALYQCLDLLDKILKTVEATKKEADMSDQVNAIIPKLADTASDSSMDVMNSSLGVDEGTRGAQVATPEPAVSVPEPEMEMQTEVTDLAPSTDGTPATQAKNSSAVDTSSTIRVQVSLLDKLMNLAGEMVLIRNQVLQFANKIDDLEFVRLSQRLDIVTSEVQNEVMQTRMQPIGNVLTKFQRVVRDLAKDLGKKIELSLEGTETELDKTLLEAVKDPLTHIVRNSCDHGIESIEERRQKGKSETGHVHLRSFHEGGQVIIEISDDGGGLNRDKIAKKALEKGLTTEQRLSKMSEKEVFQFIFSPGFSTAQAVTTVSGRGVGMDVVRTNIEKIGGQVDLNSAFGKGTSIRIKIPLTLAIVPALVVTANGGQFAIPQVKLVELVRSGEGENSDGDTKNKVEYLQGKPVFRLRGNLLPLVSLREVLGIATETDALKSTDEMNIVVLDADSQQFGLIVDEIQDTTDIVVKPLGRFMKALEVYSGATILGDGSVALILDVLGLAQNIDLVHENKADEMILKDEAAVKRSVDIQEFLFFRLNTEGKYSIPLCLVHRLEEFSGQSVEYSGEQRVVRYRGSILPLVNLSDSLNMKSRTSEKSEKNEMIPVVVVSKNRKLFGVEVNEILDVAAVDGIIDDSLKDRPGILGNIIYNEEVVVVVDILKVLEKELKKMTGGDVVTLKSIDRPENRNLLSAKKGPRKLLYVEDAAFFRKHVAKALEDNGYELIIATDGKHALEILDTLNVSDVDLILSDIEMPNLNGIELARKVRSDAKWKSIPMIALTTRFSQQDVGEGLSAGFNDYLEKFDPEQVLSKLNEIFGGKAA